MKKSILTVLISLFSLGIFAEKVDNIQSFTVQDKYQEYELINHFKNLTSSEFDEETVITEDQFQIVKEIHLHNEYKEYTVKVTTNRKTDIRLVEFVTIGEEQAEQTK
ncbi:hypothetical protein EI427_24360 [Flammeovirga pectinis]|uniref:DUF3889 domain-containing protein n=1 Tax=Flammeovirga pectinis TaxID=2494373 RepID=A0A3S9PB40_9BACT|nr:hypothetical protein [Flammeovirga pectinis]AZQ65349.1 hypothetical protein EI427_24360 [Flammeovirga pectinis]